MNRERGTTIVAVALASLALAGCSSDKNPSQPAPIDASSDSAVAVDAGADAAIDAGSDAAPSDGGATLRGLAMSPGATFSQSANYRMMWTRGGGNGASASPKYRMQSGISAASGKK